MARHLVESLTGVGPVHAGDLLLRTTRYQLSVWADDASPPAPGDAGQASAIDGRIDITGMAEATVLAGADGLTLTLEDGRRLAIRLTSTGGGIVGREWLL